MAALPSLKQRMRKERQGSRLEPDIIQDHLDEAFLDLPIVSSEGADDRVHQFRAGLIAPMNSWY